MMKFAFLLNPVSGRNKQRQLFKDIVLNFCKANKLSYTLKVIERAGQGKVLAQKAVHQGYDVVVAVGGDGTVNDVAKGLVNTSVPLGIIPAGSGNGFARGIGIPLDIRKACECLLAYQQQAIDVGQINGEYFINIAGIGLDASLALAYSNTQRNGLRGIAPYFFLGATVYRCYQPAKITLRSYSAPRINQQLTPLLVAIANGSQYGGSVRIAPQAILNDGLFDVVIVKPVAWLRLLWHLPKLFTGKFDHVSFSKTIRTPELQIESENEILYHVDGEVRSSSAGLRVSICPAAIKIIIPFP